MQLVIEIPREMYEQFKKIQIHPTDKIIANGITLPEDHGKLVDVRDLWDVYHDVGYDFYEAIDIVKPIIEARG